MVASVMIKPLKYDKKISVVIFIPLRENTHTNTHTRTHTHKLRECIYRGLGDCHDTTAIHRALFLSITGTGQKLMLLSTLRLSALYGFAAYDCFASAFVALTPSPT